MSNRKIIFTITVLLLVVSLNAVLFSSCAKERDIVAVSYIDKVQLGKLIFNDTNLSTPVGQSCASCHNPAAGFSDMEHAIVTQGAAHGLFGNRNAPNIAYSMFAPSLYFNTDDSVYVGGFFLDGRVNTLQEQAQKPFLNPLEMNNASPAALLEKIQQAAYFPLYRQVYGDIKDVATAFDNIADAIASFETTPDLNPFTSKFDYYLKGQATLTEQERRGMLLFNDTAKGKCGLCHISEPDEASGRVLFTDFTYDNIGVPKNLNNPFYNLPANFNPHGANAVDYGLGGFLNDPAEYGKFKVPTLRNAAVSAPYFHNGFFTTLEEVVHFYNKRDVANFPAPEWPATVNHNELGNLNLTEQEEKDVVAFIKTLTDGYR